MRRTLISLAAVALSAIASATSAANVITGTYIPQVSYEALIATLTLPGAGRYVIDFSLSRPGTGHLTGIATDTFEFFQDDTGEHIGGDDHPYFADIAFAPPQTRGGRTFRVCGPYVLDDGFTRTEGFCFGGHVDLTASFTGSAPVNFRLSAVPVADVPEPAAWALMILGFGATGSMLRRRRAMAAA
jgi:hypothetical protein